MERIKGCSLYLLKKIKKVYPWYDNISNQNLNSDDEFEKCVNYVHFLTKRSVGNYNNLNKKNKRKIFISSYEKIVENTYDELENISKFLNLKFSNLTKIFIKKENCPKNINKNKINMDRLYLKSKLKKIRSINF